MTSSDSTKLRMDGFMEIPGYISGSIFVAILFRYALVWAAKLHLAVAAVLAALLAIGAVWLIARVKRSQAFKEISLVVPLLSLALFTLAIVGAWVSYTIHSLNSSRYGVPAQVSVASFVDLYLYTLIDLIPGINVWDTLHVTSAIQVKDRVAGAPILIFKIIVVFLLFDAIRTWLKRRQESTIALAVATTKAESAPVE